MFPFTVVPAYNLLVYASQRPLPDTTQDSVHGCLLGFAVAAIPDGWVCRACKAQPALIRGAKLDPYVRLPHTDFLWTVYAALEAIEQARQAGGG